MTAQRIRRIAAGYQRQTILVVGDLMLDEYVPGAVRRVSPKRRFPLLRFGSFLRRRNHPAASQLCQNCARSA